MFSCSFSRNIRRRVRLDLEVMLTVTATLVALVGHQSGSRWPTRGQWSGSRWPTRGQWTIVAPVGPPHL